MTTTITLTREEAQQVLDELEYLRWADEGSYANDAIELLRARLAEPKSEDECRKSCAALCSGTGDMGGDWPCAKFICKEKNT